MKKTGIPIPLRCLTPNLLFYPLKLPTGFIWLFINKNINQIKEENTINLNEEEHLIFVNTLMRFLNINYEIVGAYLIDLTRRDFKLNIDANQNITILNYKVNNHVIYLSEKYLKKIRKLEYKIDEDMAINKMDYIYRHCRRIANNTDIIEKTIKDNFFQ